MQTTVNTSINYNANALHVNRWNNTQQNPNIDSEGAGEPNDVTVCWFSSTVLHAMEITSNFPTQWLLFCFVDSQEISQHKLMRNDEYL